MDPIKNPFSPGAGAPPPELVGRDQILQAGPYSFRSYQTKTPREKHDFDWFKRGRKNRFAQ